MTDRYLVTGGTVPCIYPGTLPALTDAMKDARNASLHDTHGQRILFRIVTGRPWHAVRVYESGVCTWVPSQTE